MHICHLILTHSFAGSERYAIELANAQSERHQVSVILHRRGCETRSNALAQRLNAAVQVFQVSGPKWLASRRARALLNSLRPDVAHAHLSAGCKALKKLAHADTLRIASLHIHYKTSQHAWMDALIAIAPWQLAEIPPALRAKSKQIDNWTQATPADADTRRQVRAEWQVSDDDFVFGTLGRVEPAKGHDVLLKAFARLADGRSKLVIVGDGSASDGLRKQLPAELQARVIWHGYSNTPQACLAGFDGFVSAARSEPFGLVFLEAMVAKLPIIATATEGARYLQAHFQQPLVPIDQPQDLADAMQAMLQTGRQRVERDLSAFDCAARIADIEDFYQQAAHQRKP